MKQDAQTLIRFCGEVFEPLCSGALFWRAQNTLLVADLHLEKMSAFAARGQLLPPYDTGLTLKRLAADIAATGAQKLIALGDSFHRDEGTTTLLDKDRALLDGLLAQVNWTWLGGNHDPSAHQLGGQCLERLQHGAILMHHEPKKGTGNQMAGHLHPAARVLINGRSVRRPCFVHDDSTMILPSYGVSTGSLNILSDAFAGLFAFDRLCVFMAGRDRVYEVSAKRLVMG